MNLKHKPLPRSVTTVTPQRVSFVGGGTDLPSFYEEHGGRDTLPPGKKAGRFS